MSVYYYRFSMMKINLNTFSSIFYDLRINVLLYIFWEMNILYSHKNNGNSMPGTTEIFNGYEGCFPLNFNCADVFITNRRYSSWRILCIYFSLNRIKTNVLIGNFKYHVSYDYGCVTA